MKLSERAKQTYIERFSELSEVKRFHFATRLKNFQKVSEFDDYLQNNIPPADLAEILKKQRLYASKFLRAPQRLF